MPQRVTRELKQANAPLWEALKNYALKKVVPFHTPGHKLRSGVFPIIENLIGSNIFAIDSSDELESALDNHQFELVLAKAELLAAELFEANQTFFLVNGTTIGIHSLLLSMIGKVLVPRFSHQSVFSGLLLSDVRVTYIPLSLNKNWDIPVPPSLTEIKEFLSRESFQALMLTYPTYYGTCFELAKLLEDCKSASLQILVDEAHGGHFQFSDYLPSSSLKLGADAVVQSTHKTLGSLTQSSMLHVGNDKLIPEFKKALTVLQTTSPSLPMLAVLDAVRRELYYNGKELVNKAIEFAHFVRKQLAFCSSIRVLPSDLQHDPTKIVFSLKNLGLTGIQVEEILRKDYNIQIEMSDYYYAVVFITIGDTYQSVCHLVDAIKDICERKHLHQVSSSFSNLPDYPPLPLTAMTLREAFYRQSEKRRIDDSVGSISSEFITPYPPGIPLIVPGEVISDDIVEYLKKCMANGWFVRGIEGEKVLVIKE